MHTLHTELFYAYSKKQVWFYSKNFVSLPLKLQPETYFIEFSRSKNM